MKYLVVKAIAGFFYVEDENGNSLECKARGNLKGGKKKIKVGDLVEISQIIEGKAVIERLLPRKNSFIRPDVSNIDSFVLVFSIKDPDINLELLDKFIVMAEKADTEVIICLNKIELAEKKEIKKITSIYDDFYKVLEVSALQDIGIEELLESIEGKHVAFTGPSGSGKSTLTNLILGSKLMETGDLSSKTGRGKHTTRHSQIFKINDSTRIFDTPGFTAFEVMEMEERELKNYFPEFKKYSKNCKYANCNHLTEPECGVKEALASGDIVQSRYDSYQRQFTNMSERNKKW